MRPRTTTWAPMSDWGFSSTGFMSTVAGVRQASACKAWARPISPPSAVTAALLDMFCGLNGRTASPLSVKRRQRPATRVDLPTSDPQPWIISAAKRRLPPPARAVRRPCDRTAGRVEGRRVRAPGLRRS